MSHWQRHNANANLMISKRILPQHIDKGKRQAVQRVNYNENTFLYANALATRRALVGATRQYASP